MTETVERVCGVEIRTCDVYPEQLVTFANGDGLVVYFWQGAEIARIHHAVPLAALAAGEVKHE